MRSKEGGLKVAGLLLRNAPLLSLLYPAIWSALMHWALALGNVCKLVKLTTLLSAETFGVLIAIIYIKDAVSGFVSYFSDYTVDAAFASLIIGLGTFYVGTEGFQHGAYGRQSQSPPPLHGTVAHILSNHLDHDQPSHSKE